METENPEPERSPAPEESGSLNRNRSFKSKQLVRSQAIRESHSPPRAASPAAGHPAGDPAGSDVSAAGAGNSAGEDEREEKRRPVEIQITGGSWEGGEVRARRRWPPQRDLLSNAPRVACVAGCRHSHHCRQRRNPRKQDSGISCPDDCADCSDHEHTGDSTSDVRKSVSLDSDESYCRCPERRDKPKNNSLSRTESADTEKVEPTGPELVNFIKDTLNKNPRDRMTLLKIEKELHALVTDTGRCIVKFPVMTSYGRMLVHRVASLFQLNHHLDQNSKNSVTVSKSGTCGGRIPCTSFRQWCTTNFPPSPVRHQDSINAKSILKRDTHSPDDAGASCRAVERSKSLEQREREYERVRRRIFSSDNCTQDESQWPWVNAGPVKLLTPDSGRNKLLKVQSLETSGPPSSWRNRGAVSKSHSFGGYGGAEPRPRLLSRQGDLASSSWRLSPSSSGYKTLSLRSTDSVTPSPTGGASPEPMAEGALVWAVTDLSAVPPGALVLHPQTGRPLTNPDGSIYHFDPANPPVIHDAGAYIHDDKSQDCDTRRGRLEKQHSFIDAEAECRCEETRGKCCCECRRHDACNHRTSHEKLATQEQKPAPDPSSPVKNRHEPTAEQPTNQSATSEPPANHRPQYDATTNQRTAEPEPPSQPFQPDTFEPKQSFEQFESPNQRIENRTYASPQRPPSFDPLANQRVANESSTNQIAPVNKLTNHESVEVPQYAHYNKGYRNDEMTSPPQMMQNHVIQPDVAGVYNIMAQAKITPIPVHDPNIRPMSLTNMIFPAPMPQPYPFVNQVRMEQPLQPLYQPMMEEQKLAPSPHTNDTTFRIDPSYPYAPLQYGGCATCSGACLDPGGQHQRYLGYGQMEQPMLQQPCVGNVLLQHNVQHYPYQEAMPWAGAVPMQAPKVLMQELCPVYPQYPYMYPQMMPPPYVACAGRRERRDSDIAVKIQQIKDQMAQLNTQEKQKTGNGLLGNAPAPYNGRVGRPVNDETHLTSAARAIVSSIRSMQANSFHADPRRQYSEGARERDRRRLERDDKRRPPRQLSPNWFRRSPGPVHPVLNHPRRPHPDARNVRR